jgi:putative transposase
MKKSRFTESQVAYALRQAEAGTPVSDVCRSLGICDATFYNWKKRYGDLGASEVRRLRQLEDENARGHRQLQCPLFNVGIESRRMISHEW